MSTFNKISQDSLPSFDVDELNLRGTIFLRDDHAESKLYEPKHVQENENILDVDAFPDGRFSSVTSNHDYFDSSFSGDEESLPTFPEFRIEFVSVDESCEEKTIQEEDTSTSFSNESILDKISEDGNHREKRSEGSIKKSRKRKQFSKDEATETPKKKRGRGRPKGWKKDKDHPKNALTAYNLFFRDERKKVLSSIEVSDDTKNTRLSNRNRKGRSDPHGKISFSELGKTIGQNWRNASEETKGKYNEMALVEKIEYEKKVEEYKRKKETTKNAK